MRYKEAREQLHRHGAAHAAGATLCAMYAEEIAAKHCLRPEPIYRFLRTRSERKVSDWGAAGMQHRYYADYMAGVTTRLGGE